MTVLGGQRRVVRVTFDRDRLAAHNVSLVQAFQALSGLNWRLPAGSFSAGNTETLVEVGSLFRRADDVGSAVVGAFSAEAGLPPRRRERRRRPRGGLAVRVDADARGRRRPRRDDRRREEAGDERRRARRATSTRASPG